MLPGNGAQNTVDKRFQVIKAFSLCQFHRFIADGTVRDTVHKFNLIYRTAQNLSDHRLHLIYSYFGIGINDIVDQNPVFQCSFAHTGNECSLLSWKELIFGKRIADCNMAVLSFFFNFQ